MKVKEVWGSVEYMWGSVENNGGLKDWAVGHMRALGGKQLAVWGLSCRLYVGAGYKFWVLLSLSLV